jgi:shikimate dehydrogenase
MKTYGLIGKSLKHSFSKSYFEKKFADLGIHAEYMNFELEAIEEFPNLISGRLRTDGTYPVPTGGLNVTIPYKQSILPYLDDLDATAKQIGAVNCIQFKNGKLTGHNTDAYGFQQLIKPFFEAHHERALIIGTGGASKAVNFVLEQLGVSVVYLSRNPRNLNEFSYDDANENMIRFNKIIVNTTPLGMFPTVNEAPPVPYEFITPQHLVIDLIYNPNETLFLKKAKEKGAVAINGETMLHQQAERSWEIWNSDE